MLHDTPSGEPQVVRPDPPCFTVTQDESSRNVTEPPSTSADALRLAIKLAVDAGEYERADALLAVLRRTSAPAIVTPIGRARRGPLK